MVHEDVPIVGTRNLGAYFHAPSGLHHAEQCWIDFFHTDKLEKRFPRSSVVGFFVYVKTDAVELPSNFVFLTLYAVNHLRRACENFDAEEFAVGMITEYGRQLSHGLPLLIHGESLAKLYTNTGHLYLFLSEADALRFAISQHGLLF